jgi:hypothetical protein
VALYLVASDGELIVAVDDVTGFVVGVVDVLGWSCHAGFGHVLVEGEVGVLRLVDFEPHRAVTEKAQPFAPSGSRICQSFETATACSPVCMVASSSVASERVWSDRAPIGMGMRRPITYDWL